MPPSAARIAKPVAIGLPPGRWVRIVTGASVTVGLAAAMALVVADVHLRHAVQSGDQGAIRSAAGWFGDDPFVLDLFVMDSYRSSIASGRAERTKVALREIAEVLHVTESRVSQIRKRAIERLRDAMTLEEEPS